MRDRLAGMLEALAAAILLALLVTFAMFLLGILPVGRR